MGNLSNLYISQSFQSLIHLGTNDTASANLIGLEDGYGNPIGISVNTAGDLHISGTFTASLQNGYVWVGDSNNTTTLVATSSFGGGGGSVDTGSFLLTGSADLIQTAYGKLQINVGPNSVIGQTGFEVFNTGSDASGSIEIGVTTPGNPFIKLKKQTWFQIGPRDELVYDAFTASFDNGIYVGDYYSSGKIGLLATSGSLGLFNGNPTANRVLTNIQTTGNVSNNGTNLVFVDNSGTTTTIVSGSANIWTNPTSVTSGFNRYIGGNQNYFGLALPQLTGSAAFSPSMNNNIINTNMLMRVPVSSSAYTINSNVLMNAAGNGVQLGTAAATNFEKAMAGVSMLNNIINGSLIATAYKTNLSASVTIAGNSIGGALTLNADSSSIAASALMVQGGLTVNNSYFPSTVSSTTGFVSVSTLVNIGSNTIYLSGSNSSMFGPPRGISNGSLIGTANVVSSSLNGDNTSVNSVNILGQSLTVVGTNSRPFGPSAADWGSAFVGRWNAVDGNREQSAKNVFVVGTGASAATRKTGFLIDSGSNTYVEGTLNVSGSTTMTGSVHISETLTLGSSDPLPAGTIGMLAVSASHLWFYNGAWVQLD